jgi:hypothetical protein
MALKSFEVERLRNETIEKGLKSDCDFSRIIGQIIFTFDVYLEIIDLADKHILLQIVLEAFQLLHLVVLQQKFLL